MEVAVRKTNGLEIWFADSRNIYIKHKYGVTLFSRWEVRERGFWSKNWKPFRKALSDNRYLDLGYITRLATRHDISINYVSKIPDYLTNAKIIELAEKGRKRNNDRFNKDYRRY